MRHGRRRGLLVTGVAVLALTGCTSGSKPPVVPVVGERGAIVGGGMALPEQLLEPPVVTAAQRQLVKNKRVGRLCDALKTLDDLPEPSRDDVAELSEYAAQIHGVVSSIDYAKKLDDEKGEARIKVPAEVVEVLTDLQAHAYAYMMRLNSINGLRADLVKRSAELDVTRAEVDAALSSFADLALVQLLNSSHTADVRALEQARPTLCPTQV